LAPTLYEEWRVKFKRPEIEATKRVDEEEMKRREEETLVSEEVKEIEEGFEMKEVDLEEIQDEEEVEIFESDLVLEG